MALNKSHTYQNGIGDILNYNLVPSLRMCVKNRIQQKHMECSLTSNEKLQTKNIDDYARTFLPQHLKNSSFRVESADASALLNLMNNMPGFSKSQVKKAKSVQSVRNDWAHCSDGWNAEKYKKALDAMASLSQEMHNSKQLLATITRSKDVLTPQTKVNKSNVEGSKPKPGYQLKDKSMKTQTESTKKKPEQQACQKKSKAPAGQQNFKTSNKTKVAAPKISSVHQQISPAHAKPLQMLSLSEMTNLYLHVSPRSVPVAPKKRTSVPRTSCTSAGIKRHNVVSKSSSTATKSDSTSKKRTPAASIGKSTGAKNSSTGPKPNAGKQGKKQK